MKKRLFNLFLVASYLFATGTAALHTHDHGHGHHDHPDASEGHSHSHVGCGHHHDQQIADTQSGSQDEPHEHEPAYEHECALCSFAGLQSDVTTTPQAQTVGAVLDGIVWLEPTKPTPAAFDAWHQRGPPMV